MKYLWKGKLVDQKDIKIDLHDRGYQFGDGIYEFVRVYNGKCFALQEHIDRLFNSAKMIELNIGYTKLEIAEFIEALVVQNEVVGGHVYLQVTRGDQLMRNHTYPVYSEQHSVISGFTNTYQRNTKRITNGVNAILYPDLRGLLCNCKSLNLLPNCMAISYARDHKAEKAILYKDDYITEERAGNVFIIKNGGIITHPTGPEILNGITRMFVFEIATVLGIPIEERRFTKEELLSADEVIVTDSKNECCPVIEIDKQVIGDGKRGRVTGIIQVRYEKEIIERCGGL